MRERFYHICSTCDLVFLAFAQRPTLDQERAEYNLHENDITQPGYRKHLMRLAGPLFAHAPLGVRALDFGCGPQASLSVLMGELGYQVIDYDPIFNPIGLSGNFDRIAMSEVAEHLFEPHQTFGLIASLLANGGKLGVMTELRDFTKPFSDWYYIREQSHVTFYSANTLEWLADHHGWQLERPEPRVGIFSKQS